MPNSADQNQLASEEGTGYQGSAGLRLTHLSPLPPPSPIWSSITEIWCAREKRSHAICSQWGPTLASAQSDQGFCCDEQWIPWSNWADAEADLSLHSLNMEKVSFQLLLIIWSTCTHAEKIHHTKIWHTKVKKQNQKVKFLTFTLLNLNINKCICINLILSIKYMKKKKQKKIYCICSKYLDNLSLYHTCKTWTSILLPVNGFNPCPAEPWYTLPLLTV